MRKKLKKLGYFVLHRSTITGEFVTTYSLIDLFRIVRDVLVCKIFINTKVRRVKLPYQIIGKKYIQFGENFTAGRNLRLEVKKTLHNSNNPVLSFGKNTKLNDYVHIGCIDEIRIGNDVLVGSNVLIIDHNHGRYGANDPEHDSPFTTPDSRKASHNKIVIHDNVWIGEYVSILPGAEIGSGCVVGAMTVINKKIPPNCIVAGIPAKIIKKYNEDTGRWEKFKS